MGKGYIVNDNKIKWRLYNFQTKYFGEWAYQHQFCLGKFTLRPKKKRYLNDWAEEILNTPNHVMYIFEWLWWSFAIRKKYEI